MPTPHLPSRHPCRGLTVIELMVVFIILAILLGLAYGVGQRLAESTRVSTTLKTISMLYNACEAYRFMYGDYPPAEADNRITFDPGATPLMDPKSPHILNAIHVNYKFDMANLSPDGVYLDPWGNPFIYEIIYSDEGNAATEGSGLWWAERGLTSRVKIYSVGAEGNFDTTRDTGPYWQHFIHPDTGEPLVLFKQIGE